MMLPSPNSAAPSVSVVIPVHNGAHVIGGQLDALSNQRYGGDFEVLVADNMSTDELEEALEPFRHRLNLRLVKANHKRGVSHARNAGCAAARSELIAVCDADDVVDANWLAAMVSALDTCSLVGGRRDTRTINPILIQRWRTPPPERLETPFSFLPYPNGANFGMRREVFERIGGWDEELVAGGDDVDFGWRAQLAGFSLGFAPEALVHYRLRGTLRDTTRQVYAYNLTKACLLVRYRPHGARPRPVRAVAADLVWLLTRCPYVLFIGSWRQGRWLVRAAAIAGRVHGAWRERVWAL
jgi:GT2 family glycosyltransferase